MNIFQISMFFCSFLLTSCGMLSNTIELKTTRQLNPDTLRRPLPVLVRAYGLTDIHPFNEATFRQLWEHDKNILGSTLIDRSERMLSPNTKTFMHLTRDPNIRYIGVMAVFRNPVHNRWRVVIQKPFFGSVAIRLSGNHITLQS